MRVDQGNYKNKVIMHSEAPKKVTKHRETTESKWLDEQMTNKIGKVFWVKLIGFHH